MTTDYDAIIDEELKALSDCSSVCSDDELEETQTNYEDAYENTGIFFLVFNEL